MIAESKLHRLTCYEIWVAVEVGAAVGAAVEEETPMPTSPHSQAINTVFTTPTRGPVDAVDVEATGGREKEKKRELAPSIEVK
jgi:hypothetical protein